MGRIPIWERLGLTIGGGFQVAVTRAPYITTVRCSQSGFHSERYTVRSRPGCVPGEVDRRASSSEKDDGGRAGTLKRYEQE
jgi:hypothetical protein